MLDGSAECAAKVASPVARPQQLAVAVIRIRNARAERLVHEILERAATELVRARLGHQVEHAAGHRSVFG